MEIKQEFSPVKQMIEKPKRVRKRWLIFLLAFLGLLIISTGVFAVYITYQICQPMKKTEGDFVEVMIKKGMSVKEIAAELEEKNIVRSAFWFEMYVWYKKEGGYMQAGKYAVDRSLNISEIAQMFSGGQVVSNEVQATIPEGFTKAQIIARLIESGIASASQMGDEAAADYDVQYKFLATASEKAGLEGFLFPDTYRFDKDVKKEEVVKKFLENFDRKLTPDLREEISRQGKTIFQIVTLASIIQQEAMNEAEMPQISGVFWNRLNKGMLLQSDATVNYITGKSMRQVTLEDIKIKSSYNTYLYAGLPPGPICNPGIGAIRAAIYPQASSYFYFLHPPGGPAVFSKTAEEHNRNRAKYLR
jgi:UPF0755 protein